MPTAAPPVRHLAAIDPRGTYTTPDVCRVLVVSEDTVYRWVAGGKLVPVARVGRRHRFTGAAVLALCTASQLAAVPGPGETRAEREARAAKARARILGPLRKGVQAHAPEGRP